MVNGGTCLKPGDLVRLVTTAHGKRFNCKFDTRFPDSKGIIHRAIILDKGSPVMLVLATDPDLTVVLQGSDIVCTNSRAVHVVVRTPGDKLQKFCLEVVR